MGFIIFCAAIFIFLLECGKNSNANHQNTQKMMTQQTFIDSYLFHPAITKKVHAKHPQLSEYQINSEVMEGLRDYFYLCHQASGQMVSMPSQVVDDAWHEFILFSHDYESFCKQALGRFLYHTPAEAMATPTSAQDGIKRAWQLACKKENIDTEKPARLPRLFALDAQLGIAGGFIYNLNCPSVNSSADSFYLSHMGCGSTVTSGGCGSGSGGCSNSGCGGGAGCGGGGCGGGGCGGGGCGG